MGSEKCLRGVECSTTTLEVLGTQNVWHKVFEVGIVHYSPPGGLGNTQKVWRKILFMWAGVHLTPPPVNVPLGYIRFSTFTKAPRGCTLNGGGVH